jgi:hypothetical protein
VEGLVTDLSVNSLDCHHRCASYAGDQHLVHSHNEHFADLNVAEGIDRNADAATSSLFDGTKSFSNGMSIPPASIAELS